MTTILIATDFSAASRNAAVYGIQMAKALKAGVILFNAYLPSAVPVADSLTLIGHDEMKSLAERKLREEANIINDDQQVPIKTICNEGTVVNTIQSIVDDNVSLIIAGAKSKGKFIRSIAGNTIKLLGRHTKVPLLVIPEHVPYFPISRVAIAYKKDVPSETGTQPLSVVKTIAEAYHAKLYLLRIIQPRLQEMYHSFNRPSVLSSYFPEGEMVYADGASHLADALADFIQKNTINLLVLFPRQHQLLNRALLRSTTNAMISATDIPLLIVPPPFNKA